jgi:hypothetical protein
MEKEEVEIKMKIRIFETMGSGEHGGTMVVRRTRVRQITGLILGQRVPFYSALVCLNKLLLNSR